MVNLFNRVVVGILLVGLVLLSVYALAITLEIAEPNPTVLGPALSQQLEVCQRWSGATWWIGFGSILSAAVLFSYLLLWELRPQRAPDPYIVEITQHGRVTVEQRSVVQLVEQAVQALPAVRFVRVAVNEAKTGGLRIACKVSAASSATLPNLGQQVQDVAKTRVEEQLGLDVVEVAATINFDAVRTDRRVLD